jgi:disulfide bond formation protein DsbB
MARRPVRGALLLATSCLLLAIRIGPARAAILFLAVLVVVAIGIGALLALMRFWFPDTNGENWFTLRNRRK